MPAPRHNPYSAPHSNIPVSPRIESWSAAPRKYPAELAIKSMAVCANNVFITPKARVMTSAINMEPTREPAHSPATPRSVKYEPTHPTAYRRNAIPNTSWNRHNRPGPITSGLSNAPPRKIKRTVQTTYAPLNPRLRYIQPSAKATVANTQRLARRKPKLPIIMERPNEGVEPRAPFC